MNRWERIGAYLLQRLGEPTTWAGITTAATAFGVNFAPDKWQAISTTGMLLVSLFLGAAREGRNKADNPTLPAVVKGELPEPKDPIVPPQ